MERYEGSHGAYAKDEVRDREKPKLAGASVGDCLKERAFST